MHESQQPYDFCGWATKFNVGCTDGRTIMPGAFEHSDGAVVPLIWNHQHSGAENVVGKAVLEARDEGMYAYGFFNGTENGQIAKELVQHGDIDSLSIFANHLREANGYVQHGEIREVSLVLTGANIEAKIEDVICHVEEDGQAAIIYPGETGLEFIMHSDEEDYEEGKDEGFEDFDTEIEHADNSKSDSLEDIFNTLTDKQKIAVYMLLDAASNNEGDDIMKHNAFESPAQRPAVDMKSFEADVIKDIKRFGSVKESYLQHSGELVDEYNATICHADDDGNCLAHAGEITQDDVDAAVAAGIAGFQSAYPRTEYDPTSVGFKEPFQGMLLPDAREMNTPPKFISRTMDWVAKVLNGVRSVPFSRIKCTFADITEDEARAKGYMKGAYKKNELFTLLKRTTQPCTIYKKKSIDRDDWIDVTDFDMIAWIKAEMSVMINEEKARAILLGDGRDTDDDDHIDHTCIRPIVNDADLFVLRWGLADDNNGNFDAKTFINVCIKSRKNYKGAGRPTLFTTEDVLTEMLLLEDLNGHKLYKTEEEVKTAIRVSEIVTVPLLEDFTDSLADGVTKTTYGTGKKVYGIIVNLNDYAVGTDVRGKRAMFDDFDIDYNKMKYLIEERFSGSLITPFSAIVIREADVTGSQEVALNDWKTIESGPNAGKKENKGSSAAFRPESANIKA